LLRLLIQNESTARSNINDTCNPSHEFRRK